MQAATTHPILSLFNPRRGHFAYESGHHGDLWLDLELLCSQPERLRPYIRELAAKLAPYAPEVICGPLVEGAFLALLVAGEMRKPFVYANRFAPQQSTEMFSVQYRVPAPLHPLVKGRGVAIVNDVISAGSAVRGTYQNLLKIGATVVAVASFAVQGDTFPQFCHARDLALETLLRQPHNLWLPDDCPLCQRGIALEQLAIA